MVVIDPTYALAIVTSVVRQYNNTQLLIMIISIDSVQHDVIAIGYRSTIELFSFLLILSNSFCE